MPYAFDEFRDLVGSLTNPISDQDPKVRYICALVAELAYLHVPQFEIDHRKRALIIPCNAYQEIIASGTASNVLEYLSGLDLERSFVVVDRSIVIVGLVINRLLFIGFRGTAFLFDWRINVRSSLAQLKSNIRVSGPMPRISVSGGGRVHKGFLEEAVRISSKIIDEIRNQNMPEIEHAFICGHSLGGAVGALSEPLIMRGWPASVCIFGSPRYCDITAYASHSVGPPTQIQRRGDIVPLVPPRSKGYADHPYQFDTFGKPIIQPIVYSSIPHFIWLSLLFLIKRFEPHSMEAYRRELGRSANARFAELSLAPFERLMTAKVGA